MPDSCIKRRMLFACRQAYDDTVPAAGAPVGWLAPPQVFTAASPNGSGQIDRALVGRIPEGIVLAFRGTLPPTSKTHPPLEVFLDWANDADLLPLENKTYPGCVHRGFAGSLDRLWPKIEAAIRSLLQPEKANNRLFVTGHSKGGALANLAAWRALDIHELASPIRVMTIAAARAGNQAFRTGYESHGGIQCLRYESTFDAVPYLPLGNDAPLWVKELTGMIWKDLPKFDYAVVGQRVLARVTAMEAFQAVQRYLSWLGIGHPRTNYVPLLVQAHDISPGSDYDTLVCTGEPGCTHV